MKDTLKTSEIVKRSQKENGLIHENVRSKIFTKGNPVILLLFGLSSLYFSNVALHPIISDILYVW